MASQQIIEQVRLSVVDYSEIECGAIEDSANLKRENLMGCSSP